MSASNNPVQTKFAKAQKSNSKSGTGSSSKDKDKSADETKPSLKISPISPEKIPASKLSEMAKILTAQPPANMTMNSSDTIDFNKDDENTAMHLLLNFKESGNRNRDLSSLPPVSDNTSKSTSGSGNAILSPLNSSRAKAAALPQSTTNTTTTASSSSSAVGGFQPYPFFLNPLNHPLNDPNDLYSSMNYVKKKFDMEIPTDLNNNNTINNTNAAHISSSDLLPPHSSSSSTTAATTTTHIPPAPSVPLPVPLVIPGGPPNSAGLNQLLFGNPNSLNSTILHHLGNGLTGKEITAALLGHPSPAGVAVGTGNGIGSGAIGINPPSSSTTGVSTPSHLHQHQHHPHSHSLQSATPSNSTKVEYNILQHFEPRFFQVFQSYQSYYKEHYSSSSNQQDGPTNTPNGEIPIRSHLLSLCLEHMIPFCCWARENAAVLNWMKVTLEDNPDLRPEVRNGIAMILMYAFSAAQAKLRVDSDMFITLQDTETGLGIVNKTSLKIYNDPYQYFNFIKTCISGLIDAGKIPENERINKVSLF
jgi:hypothetical protein